MWEPGSLSQAPPSWSAVEEKVLTPHACPASGVETGIGFRGSESLLTSVTGWHLWLCAVFPFFFFFLVAA